MSQIEDAYPLSPVQLGMLYHSLHEDPLTYVNQTVYTLTGDIEVLSLEKAWNIVVSRHPALRTSVLSEGFDEPVQVVHAEAAVPFRVIHAEGRSAVEEFLPADRELGFDLHRAPLSRITVFISRQGVSRLVWTWHHIVLDGWSSSIVLNELATAYAALRRGEPVRLAPVRPFRDYIAWLGSQELSAAEDFWRDTLAGYEAPEHFGWTAETGTARGEVMLKLPAELTDTITDAAREQGVTFNTVVQCGLAVLLSAYTGTTDVCLGVTSSGRPAEVPGIEDMVGMFLAATPLRVRLDGSAPVATMLKDTQHRQAVGRSFEFAPFSKVQNWGSTDARRGLFEALLVTHNFPPAVHHEDAPLRLEEEEGIGTTNFPLTLNAFVMDGRLGFLADYDLARFDTGTVRRMLDHLAVIVERITAAPGAPVSSLLPLPADTHTAVPAEPDDEPRTVLDMLDAAPDDALAVAFDNERLTYARLRRRVDEWAARLRASGVTRGSLVGIALERSPSIVVAALAVLRAGAAYVPIDPFLPPAVLTAILTDARPVTVVVDDGTTTDVFTDNGVPPLVLDDRTPTAAATGTPDRPAPADLAVVLYATEPGRPRRIDMTHRDLQRAAGALARGCGIGTDDVLLDLTSRLDTSPATLFAPVQTGAALHLRSERHLTDPGSLWTACGQDAITVVLAPGWMASALLDPSAPAPAPPAPGLRLLVIDREPPPVEPARQWARDNPTVRLLGTHGGAVTGNVHLLTDLTSPARPAQALPGMPAAVLDERSRPAPVGVPGRLHLGPSTPTGDLARRLPDGRIELLGRDDILVDVRGFWCSPAAVEAALTEHSGVADCAVIADGHPRRLLAYIVPAHQAPSEAELRLHARNLLPDHLVPASMITVEAIPRTPDGRPRSSALPRHVETRPRETGTELSSTATALARIWAQALNLDTVDPAANFFALGGDSITLLKIVNLAADHGLKVTPRLVFTHQSVAELAVALDALASVPDPAGAEPEPTAGGEVPLLPVQHWFFENELDDVDLWNTEFVYAVRADHERVQRAAAALIAHHDALRLRFHHDGHNWTQTIAACEQAQVCEYHDLTTLSAPEQRKAMSTAAWDAHRRIDITDGPLIRFAQFHLSPSTPDLLLVIVHHLAFDGVSSGILREDLGTALEQLAAGAEIDLPTATTPYRTWARRLAAHAGDPGLLAELDFWRGQAAAAGELPANPGGSGARPVSVSRSLSAAETRELLTSVPRVLGARTNEVLLAALSTAIHQVFGTPLLVQLEGHGREDLFDNVELYRTVGLFATQYPLMLGDATGQTPAETLGTVRERLRAVPGRGIGYGVLRYLADPVVRAELTGLARPQVFFGYLGRLADEHPPQADQLLLELPVTAVVDDDPADHSRYRADGADENGLAVSAVIEDGVLTLRTTYGPNLAGTVAAGTFADRHLDALRGLLAAAQPDPATVPTTIGQSESGRA